MMRKGIIFLIEKKYNKIWIDFSLTKYEQTAVEISIAFKN